MLFLSRLLASAVLAAALLSAMAAAGPVALASPSGADIVRQDAKLGCLSRLANATCADSRLALYDLATTLNSTPYRDFRMFAPAAKAIGRPDVAEEIRDDDYRVTLKGLECLSSSLAKFPDIRSKCAAPTAANLRTIYDALAAVLSRF